MSGPEKNPPTKYLFFRKMKTVDVIPHLHWRLVGWLPEG